MGIKKKKVAIERNENSPFVEIVFQKESQTPCDNDGWGLPHHAVD